MTEVKVARGTRGMVVAAHPLAAEAGRDVLAAGGNAVDAAVAAAGVLAVVCPYACTLGGDVFALVHSAADRRIYGLNGSGVAPAAATPDRFQDGIPRTGPLSISVPGFVAGIADLLGRFGSRSLGSLLEPAIRLAREGYPAHAQHVQNARTRGELLAQDAEAARLFLPGGSGHPAGALVLQPELADVLSLIAATGSRAFYQGDIAARLAAGIAVAGGLVTADDFAQHRGLWQEPVEAPFAGHDIVTMPPNSYGLTLLLQLLELERGGIADVDPDGAEFVLRGLAARRSAYAASDGVMGDPAVLDGPARKLLADTLAARVMAEAGAPEESRDRCTACVVVMDGEGGAVSLIQSIAAPFGSGIVAPGTGVLLNNRMPGFTTKPGHPNRVGPGKRPAHTLAPCLIMKDGRPSMAIGTPGTVGQTCTLAQVLARMLACGQSPEHAAGAARWSVTLEGKPAVEKGMATDLKARLAAQIPDLAEMPTGWITFGSVKLAMRTQDGFLGVADSRRVAAPAAF
jgi:gamma-glutamyltranspeptidase